MIKLQHVKRQVYYLPVTKAQDAWRVGKREPKWKIIRGVFEQHFQDNIIRECESRWAIKDWVMNSD